MVCTSVCGVDGGPDLFGAGRSAARNQAGEDGEDSQVDPRFLSYNVEMVEVTGGRFWAPYKADGSRSAADYGQTRISRPGIDPNLFAIRQPMISRVRDCAGLRRRWVLPICG